MENTLLTRYSVYFAYVRTFVRNCLRRKRQRWTNPQTGQVCMRGTDGRFVSSGRSGNCPNYT